MFIFALFSTFLVVLRIHACDGPEQDTLDSIVSLANIHGCTLCVEPVFHGVRFHLVRRLLEHPRWTKQAYRSNDYNVIRHQSRYKPDDSKSYRSAVANDEDDDEEEEEQEDEENEFDEENKIDDEAVNDEDEQDENENEETVNEEPSEIYDYG